MARLARVRGSLRSEGLTRIAIDIPTRSRLKALAGDIPVSQFLRGIANGSITITGTPQAPLPGTERMVSGNTLSAIADSLKSVMARLNTFEHGQEQKRSLLVDACSIDDWLSGKLGVPLGAERVVAYEGFMVRCKAAWSILIRGKFNKGVVPG